MYQNNNIEGGFSMFQPTAKDISGCIEILRSLNCIPRWSAHVGHLQDNYTEIAKLALNSQIASIMFELVAHEQEHGIGFTDYPKVRFNLLPRIALYRAFEKYEKCDILDETYQKLFSNDSKLEKAFITHMEKQVVSLTSQDLFNHISGLNETFEMKIFKAATAIATYYEGREIRKYIHSKKYADIQDRQLQRLKKYEEFPVVRELINGIGGENISTDACRICSLIEEFSSLRNRIRWVKRVPLRCYSVLGHSFDVAIYNYLLVLSVKPDDEELAEKGFYVGLYHDVAEIWTGDMPSPLKDAIPGLRKKTEELEVEVLNLKIFPLIPEWLRPKFKNVMLEMLPDFLKKFYKEGDNLAAIVEAATQLAAGSTDCYFKNVVINGYLKTNSSFPVEKEIMKKIRKDARIPYIAILFRMIKNKLSKK